jgi:hypothetical protein
MTKVIFLFGKRALMRNWMTCIKVSFIRVTGVPGDLILNCLAVFLSSDFSSNYTFDFLLLKKEIK